MEPVIREIIADQEQARREMELMAVSPAGIDIMAPKASFRLIKVNGLPLRAALILKQEMLAKGGEAALPMAASNLKQSEVDLLLMGTGRVFSRVIEVLRRQPYGLAKLADRLQRVLQGEKTRLLRCGSHELQIGERTLIMGILNVTPDSFSDGGRHNDVAAALRRARQMVDEGADIIDVGGESTRPGAEKVGTAEELERVIPVIEKLAAELDVPISIDTYKAEVAAAAIEAGAHIINDVSGLQADPDMPGLAAKKGVPVTIMHMRGTPRTMQQKTEYRDLMGEVVQELMERVRIARAAGIDEGNIILDPGIGFSKTAAQNLTLLRRLREIKSLGLPVLLGTSRKSFIGSVLDLPVSERVEGTAATVALGIAGGADIIRVHDVKEMVRVAKMTDAVLRRSEQ